ncbi:uncharacterized protein LOC128928117 isoform X2 [Callithrix jacchus]
MREKGRRKKGRTWAEAAKTGEGQLCVMRRLASQAATRRVCTPGSSALGDGTRGLCGRGPNHTHTSSSRWPGLKEGPMPTNTWPFCGQRGWEEKLQLDCLPSLDSWKLLLTMLQTIEAETRMKKFSKGRFLEGHDRVPAVLIGEIWGSFQIVSSMQNAGGDDDVPAQAPQLPILCLELSEILWLLEACQMLLL